MSKATFPEKHKGLRFSRTVLRKGSFGEKREKADGTIRRHFALFGLLSRLIIRLHHLRP